LLGPDAFRKGKAFLQVRRRSHKWCAPVESVIRTSIWIALPTKEAVRKPNTKTQRRDWKFEIRRPLLPVAIF
jgi:hypothetical protein